MYSDEKTSLAGDPTGQDRERGDVCGAASIGLIEPRRRNRSATTDRVMRQPTAHHDDRAHAGAG